jgi:ribonuclease P protein component
MLSRSQRISVEQFNSIMEKGRVSHSSLFLIRAVSGRDDTRVAAVAPQKVFKTAVVRNRVRRRMYEAIRLIEMNIKPGTQVIVFAKVAASGKKPIELGADMKALFVKAGILV